jgi:rhodanese-related sulfurtransferase
MAESNPGPFWSHFAGKRTLLIPIISADLSSTAITYGGQTKISASHTSKPEHPKAKQTVLGLYVTAKEAYEKWKAEPEKVIIIDVRTPEEYLFVGHPAMAWKIPLAARTYEWDAEKKQFPMKPLPDFVSRVSEVAKPDDTILVMCRSGGRSAMAVNLLAKAGFKHVYNIINGMEGDTVEDPGSVFAGQWRKNGWTNSGVLGRTSSLPTGWCSPRSSSRDNGPSNT